MRFRPYGRTGWLVSDLDDPVGWALAVDALAVPGIVETVPAEDTVLLVCEPPELASAVPAQLVDVEPVRPTAIGRTVTIPVAYDGPDLADVADRCGLTTDDVVERHRSVAYTVAFCGFSPGFAYLRGLPGELVLPRRAHPRTAVPAGSVAIAAGYSAVYPSASPGGWHLIGTTTAPVWDVDRAEPSLLVPGTTVRFEAR